MEIQERVRSGSLALVWSYILEFENEANPFEERKRNIAEWKKLAEVVVSSSDQILSDAMGFQALGIRNKDSLHIACAIQGGAERFFTTDDGLLKKSDSVTQIAIENPVDFTIHESRND